MGSSIIFELSPTMLMINKGRIQSTVSIGLATLAPPGKNAECHEKHPPNRRVDKQDDNIDVDWG